MFNGDMVGCEAVSEGLRKYMPFLFSYYLGDPSPGLRPLSLAVLTPSPLVR